MDNAVIIINNNVNMDYLHMSVGQAEDSLSLDLGNTLTDPKQSLSFKKSGLKLVGIS